MSKIISVLLFGDVIGQPGCRALFFNLQNLRKEHNADMVVVNGENASEGFGITPEMATNFFKSGVDVITSGNHIWQKKEIIPFLDSENKILRPHNYPAGVPGRGFVTVTIKGIKVGVLNLIGRKRMGMCVECPFKTSKKAVNKLNSETKIIIVDFHAECAQEKEALAFYLDGLVSVVAGTHTHIQTADEKILPGGTAYITDIGMTGPGNSVIGAVPELSIRRSLTQMPLKMEISENDAIVEGILLRIDSGTGKTIEIKRLRI